MQSRLLVGNSVRLLSRLSTYTRPRPSTSHRRMMTSSLDPLLATLSSSTSPDAAQIHDEILALLAIYEPINDEPSLSFFVPPSPPRQRERAARADPSSWDPAKLQSTDPPLRLLLRTSLDSDSTPVNEGEPQDLSLELVVSLPPVYPSTSPPLLQLASLYLGPYQISDSLFGDVLRTYMHETHLEDAGSRSGAGAKGVEFVGDVCVYEGVEYAREICLRWYNERRDEKVEGEKKRQKEGGATGAMRSHQGVGGYGIPSSRNEMDDSGEWEDPKGFEELEVEEDLYISAQPYEKTSKQKKGLYQQEEEEGSLSPVITSSTPITDRKSTFIGHAASVQTPSDVDSVLRTLLADKRIARASHPTLFAYRFTTADGRVYHDNDDDGEAAAGSRLAHLLTIMDLDNVLVVVSRWYGGVHLGSDRFKHINAAAREALELGGFLEMKGKTGEKKGKKGK